MVKVSLSVFIFFTYLLLPAQESSSQVLYPSLVLKNPELETVHIHLDQRENHYTLLHFWQSQSNKNQEVFEQLAELHHLYAAHGFSIISVCTGKKKHYDEWSRNNSERIDGWEHYWDENGKEAQKLGVRITPVNILFNHRDHSIEKYISQEELERFLLAKSTYFYGPLQPDNEN